MEPIAPHSMGRMSSAFPAETVERGNVHGVEALSDAEQEYSDDDECDEDRKGYADLDHERHAPGAGRRQYQAILQRHETDHLAHSIAPRHHDQEAEQHHRQGKG